MGVTSEVGDTTLVKDTQGIEGPVGLEVATLGCPVSVIFWREVGHEYLAKTTRDYSLI